MAKSAPKKNKPAAKRPAPAARKRATLAKGPPAKLTRATKLAPAKVTARKPVVKSTARGKAVTRKSKPAGKPAPAAIARPVLKKPLAKVASKARPAPAKPAPPAKPTVAVKAGVAVKPKLAAPSASAARSAQSPVVASPRPVVVPDPILPVVKPRRNASGLGARDLQHFADLLLEKRREIVGDMHSMEGEALRSGTNGLSTLPVHMADMGTDNYEQEFTLGLVEKDRTLLREINHALAKIPAGTFGICEGTGDPIGKPRLEVQPWARHSIEYARLRERNGRGVRMF